MVALRMRAGSNELGRLEAELLNVEHVVDKLGFPGLGMQTPTAEPSA